MTPALIAALAATLDRDEPFPEAGDPLPPLWHWLYFLPIHRASDIGSDGHAERGGFLPPVQLPRRMFAGARFWFNRPIRVGETVTRRSRIADVSCKDGRSGPLVFVVARHEISGRDGVAVVEEQDIVYRSGPVPGASPPPPEAASNDAVWRREVRPDEEALDDRACITTAGCQLASPRPHDANRSPASFRDTFALPAGRAVGPRGLGPGPVTADPALDKGWSGASVFHPAR